MILPCRIHRARTGNCVDSLPLALLFAVSLFALPPSGTRAEPVAGAAGSTSQDAGASWLPNIPPLHISVRADAGYDSNVDLTTSGGGSEFTRGSVSLSYDRHEGPTRFNLSASGGFTHFLNATNMSTNSANTSNDDVNTNLTLSLTHIFSTRLSFDAAVTADYQTEPNFKTNVGPTNVRANHFNTTDSFSLAYHWLPRFTTTTSFTFTRVKYDDASIGMFEDLIETTFGETFSFSRSSRTNLFLEYRFQATNYDTAPNNSVTHYALAGFDHHLTEHLLLNVRGGETFQSIDTGTDSINPDFEGSLTYMSGRMSLGWTASYGVEAPTVEGAATSITLRTGLTFSYNLSARISATAAVYYSHADNQGTISSGTGSTGPQDSFDLSLGLSYTINQHFAVHVDYSQSSVTSPGSTPESTQGLASSYSRNSVFRRIELLLLRITRSRRGHGGQTGAFCRL